MERNTSRNRIVPLDDLDDYEVAEGDPDVEGWEVIASDGREIGKVKNLLADATAMKVRYLDVDLSNDLVRNRENSHVLIPIGHVRVIEEDNRVMAESLSSNEVLELPEYTGGPVTREYETTLRQRFDRDYRHGTVADEDFYSHDLYDEERFYGRGVGAGSSGVREVPGGETNPRRDPIDRSGRTGPAPDRDRDL